jgi:hypothetical protein
MHELLCHKPSQSAEVPQMRVHEAQGQGEGKQEIVNVPISVYFPYFQGIQIYPAFRTAPQFTLAPVMIIYFEPVEAIVGHLSGRGGK